MDGLRRLDSKLRQARESINGEQAGAEDNGEIHHYKSVHKEERRRES